MDIFLSVTSIMCDSRYKQNIAATTNDLAKLAGRGSDLRREAADLVSQRKKGNKEAKATRTLLVAIYTEGDQDDPRRTELEARQRVIDSDLAAVSGLLKIVSLQLGQIYAAYDKLYAELKAYENLPSVNLPPDVWKRILEWLGDDLDPKEMKTIRPFHDYCRSVELRAREFDHYFTNIWRAPKDVESTRGLRVVSRVKGKTGGRPCIQVRLFSPLCFKPPTREHLKLKCWYRRLLGGMLIELDFEL